MNLGEQSEQLYYNGGGRDGRVPFVTHLRIQKMAQMALISGVFRLQLTEVCTRP